MLKPKRNSRTRHLWRYCFWPLIILSAFALGTANNSFVLLETALSVNGLNLPILPPLIFIVLLAVSFSFGAHFSENISAFFSWLTIIVSGVLVILIFAFLHRAAGVICTGPVCPNADAFFSDGQLLFSTDQFVPAENNQYDWNTVYVDNSLPTALYFSIVTFTTLGYGDMQPVPTMRLYAAFEALIGYLYLGMVVGAAIDFGLNARKRATQPLIPQRSLGKRLKSLRNFRNRKNRDIS